MDINIITSIIIPSVLLLAIGLFLFTEQKRLAKISFSIGEIVFEINFFEDKVDDVSKELKSAGIDVPDDIDSYLGSYRSTNVSDRDAVIDSLEPLAQLIRILASERNISVMESSDIVTIVKKLIANDVLPAAYIKPVQALYKLGSEVRKQRKAGIDSASRKKYQSVVAALVKTIKRFLRPTTTTTTTPSSRKTQVGNVGFVHPERGRPTADLYCQAGMLQGQHFPIDKPIYRLGANSQNDLLIPNDSYVSGNHAYISYEQGNLMLFDDGSRNGTFLNGNRLNRTPMVLKLGDKIKLGGCIFELT